MVLSVYFKYVAHVLDLSFFFGCKTPEPEITISSKKCMNESGGFSPIDHKKEEKLKAQYICTKQMIFVTTSQ